MDSPAPCPCGSRLPYDLCCRPLHAGGAAVDPTALMRSRFSAFVLGDADYLRASWHPSTRPGPLDLDDGTRWRRLQIVDSSGGGSQDATGVVHFRASFLGPSGAGVLEELSRFVRSGGRWVYLDGDVIPHGD